MLTLDAMRIELDGFTLRADLSIPAGSCVAVLGPSGGGKSTLLSAIAGFVTPVSGKVLWMGKDLTEVAPGQRPISILFQDNNLFPHLTAAQNVGLGLGPRLRQTPAERERIEGALATVGLEGLGHRKPGTLSGGQQSRVALARALVADRPVVLLDEPFSALGPALKNEMLDLAISTLATAGRTLLMVTHDPADARRSATEVVLVAEGEATGPVATRIIFEDPPPALRRYLGSSGAEGS